MTRSWLIVGAGLAVCASPSLADEPELREGLWTIRQQTTEKPSGKKRDTTFKLCRNHAFDHHANELAKKVPGCEAPIESRSSGKRQIEQRCTIQGSVMVTKAVTTYDADAIHSESHTTTTPPLFGVSETLMIQDHRFEGSCPAGTQPGDKIDSTGKVTHLPNR